DAEDAIVVLRRAASSVTVRGREVERAVGPLPHGPDPAVLALEEGFLSNDGRPVQDDADDPLAAETAEEEAPAEVRERRASIERAAGRGEGRRVFEQRRFHAGPRLPVVDDGPAVVPSPLDDVDLVAAARSVEPRRSVLRLEQQARPRLPVETLRVPV